MPGIPLREYVHRIEAWIRSGEQERAIAHGRHLLSLWPDCIWVHRILGEAYLDRGMLTEAQESFERTLAADPENALAQIGLSLTYDRKGMLAEAIRHMERAFDTAAGNAEVRTELQALYQRRGDSRSAGPALTRGAMARVYAHNGLLDRAIAEYREALHQNPGLPDAQAGLAEALWRAGEGQQALETCRQLLEERPGCLKALLIRAQLLLERGQGAEAEAEAALTQAQALDPENRLAYAMMGERSPLPPREVLVTELAEGGAPGVAGDEEETMVESEEDAAPEGERLPGWLQESLPADTPAAAPAEEEGAPKEPAPEWMEPWESDGASEAEAPAGSEETPSDELAPPAWMETPAEQAVEEESVPAEAMAAERTALEEVPGGIEEAGPDASPPAAAAVPDWVRRMQEVVTDESVPASAEALGTAGAMTPVLAPAGSDAERQRVRELTALLHQEPGKYWARIELARMCCKVGDWDGALLQYEELIAGHKLIRAVILDLQELLQQETDRVQVYRLLGDAYMESDQIDQALEMYRLARQILRKR